MVKFIYKVTTFIILLVLMALSFVSCEDVVDVDLDTANPNLVIEASILWKKGTNGNEQKIKLSTTTDYYSNVIPLVSGATVFITDSSNTYNFIENPGTGEYICGNFNPIINETYVLTVIANGETYIATEKLKAVPTIDTVQQDDEGGFLGDEIEVKFFYQDNGLTNDFYLIQFNSNFSLLPEYDVTNDEFFQGNQMFGLYTNEDMKPSDVLTFTLHGISERYYNYLNVLLGISGGNGGSPFNTPPATVRGNFVNQTNSDNFAFGYFSLSEIDTKTYIIQ
ncbi:DUF4249 domain-containing protein [uncultured Flavobacterium sp.]|uniref:DUF4249 domain-containing protein n=1 Tax=uncultured Flavobacterium sp. TaxID=165435 RepID=UPI0030C808DD